LFLTIISVITSAAIAYTILYFVIKAAVRNGIIEARHIDNTNGSSGNNSKLPQKTCPNCNKNHDFDYPKCPHCNHQH